MPSWSVRSRWHTGVPVLGPWPWWPFMLRLAGVSASLSPCSYLRVPRHFLRTRCRQRQQQGQQPRLLLRKRRLQEFRRRRRRRQWWWTPRRASHWLHHLLLLLCCWFLFARACHSTYANGRARFGFSLVADEYTSCGASQAQRAWPYKLGRLRPP